MKFVSKTKHMVACYGGTQCSMTVPAEITDPALIAKAQANPDFVKYVAKKKTTKKKVSRKK